MKPPKAIEKTGKTTFEKPSKPGFTRLSETIRDYQKPLKNKVNPPNTFKHRIHKIIRDYQISETINKYTKTIEKQLKATQLQ